TEFSIPWDIEYEGCKIDMNVSWVQIPVCSCTYCSDNGSNLYGFPSCSGWPQHTTNGINKHILR
ncbi:Hypothetical predicted protein, partial [Pelobates cultripes]